ncbi:FeoA family protein [Clostridium sp. Marseille-P299]|uniref:FeoA family protein n=1 Tax=Clostridium sp. Marseille-P299 TaxID=1805477 RepID=UPI00082F5066|nr:FeoA family protein [Clostridium sp. Marseille-P299]
MTRSGVLAELKTGQQAVVTELNLFDSMRRRLQDIGLIEGTVVECLGKSPLGDPTAFLIRGAVIALRSDETKRVIVRVSEREE